MSYFRVHFRRCSFLRDRFLRTPFVVFSQVQCEGFVCTHLVVFLVSQDKYDGFVRTHLVALQRFTSQTCRVRTHTRGFHISQVRRAGFVHTYPRSCLHPFHEFIRTRNEFPSSTSSTWWIRTGLMGFSNSTRQMCWTSQCAAFSHDTKSVLNRERRTHDALSYPIADVYNIQTELSQQDIPPLACQFFNSCNASPSPEPVD